MKEERDTNTNKYQKPKNMIKTVLLVLAWIFFLPFTATYFIAKSKKLDVAQKIVIIVAMWVILFIIGSIEEKNEAILKKEMITKCYSQETYDKLDELIGMRNIRITVPEDKKCNDLEIKDSSYEPIKIKMNEEKELVSITIKDKTIYGEAPKPTVKEKEVNKREPKKTENKNTNQQNKNKKSTKKEKSTKEETPKKADYEFETLEGYTTLQSLLININKGDRYKKIKNMADYCNYYVKTMHGVEDSGTVIVIYNSSEKDYHTKSTEDVKIAFEGYHNGKIDFFDYSSNGFSYLYDFSDLSGYVDKYGEEDKEYKNLREAFKYINQRVGYTG